MLVKKVLIGGAILLLSTSAAMAQSKGAQAALRACKPDIAQYCSQERPGGGRIKACMKQHMHELSEPCKEAMFQMWLHH